MLSDILIAVSHSLDPLLLYSLIWEDNVTTAINFLSLFSSGIHLKPGESQILHAEPDGLELLLEPQPSNAFLSLTTVRSPGKGINLVKIIDKRFHLKVDLPFILKPASVFLLCVGRGSELKVTNESTTDLLLVLRDGGFIDHCTCDM